MAAKDLVIKCPNTGKELFTGIAMDEKSFESGNIHDNMVDCPFCGQMHVWQKEDAHLKE